MVIEAMNEGDRIWAEKIVMMKANTGRIPGCKKMRRQEELDAFDSYKKRTGNSDYSAWRERKIRERELEGDPGTKEAFQMVVWHDTDGALGNISFYNVRVLGLEGDLLSYECMLAPFCPPEVFSEVVKRMLNRPVRARARNGDPIRVQLQRVRFPVRDVKNRWDVKYTPEVDVERFAGRHRLTWSNDNGQRFLSLLERVAPDAGQ